MKSTIPQLVSDQRRHFESHATKPLEERLRKLNLLHTLIKEYENDIFEALKNDLGKSNFEAFATEVMLVLDEIKYFKKHLKKLMSPEKGAVPLPLQPSKAYLTREPYGVVLILAPWNYPFQLTMLPLVGAIAAGNCCILKPSEYTKHTSQLMSELIHENFSKGEIAVVQGAVEESTELLEQEFDYIFFTGSAPVGKVVLEKASRNLTPVTLELGGKSPCIVDKSAKLEVAARRIAWGKFINAGQTCIAPDYVLVHESVKDKFVTLLKRALTEFNEPSSKDSESYAKIVNQKHFKHLEKFIANSKILHGGSHNKIERSFEITVIEVDDLTHPSMQEEIFGPVLPLLTYKSNEDASKIINSHPKPLAFYIFTEDKLVEKYFLRSHSFGGGCINDTLTHLGVQDLPFGGVGNSGMGQYHGKYSFETFTHSRSIMKMGTWVDLAFRYPPYTLKKLNFIRKFFG